MALENEWMLQAMFYVKNHVSHRMISRDIKFYREMDYILHSISSPEEIESESYKKRKVCIYY